MGLREVYLEEHASGGHCIFRGLTWLTRRLNSDDNGGLFDCAVNIETLKLDWSSAP